MIQRYSAAWGLEMVSTLSTLKFVDTSKECLEIICGSWARRAFHLLQVEFIPGIVTGVCRRSSWRGKSAIGIGDPSRSDT